MDFAADFTVHLTRCGGQSFKDVSPRRPPLIIQTLIQALSERTLQMELG